MTDYSDIQPIDPDDIKNLGPIDNLTPIDAFNLGVSVGKRLALDVRYNDIALDIARRILNDACGSYCAARKVEPEKAVDLATIAIESPDVIRLMQHVFGAAVTTAILTLQEVLDEQGYPPAPRLE